MVRKVLITGGSGRIAIEIIKGLLLDNHEVIFTSRKQANIDEAINNHFNSNSRVVGIELDLLDKSDLDKWARGLPFKIDAIIHNARSLDTLKNDKFGNASFENFQDELSMAVTKPYLLTNALLKSGQPLRDIIFISSMYGVVAPNPQLYNDFHKQSPIQYGTAKAAQIHLTKELAVRLSDRAIRVNCISFGGVEGRVDTAFKGKYSKLTPMKRMLKENDLYPPVKYILNNSGLAITGENLKVDGGWTVW